MTSGSWHNICCIRPKSVVWACRARLQLPARASGPPGAGAGCQWHDHHDHDNLKIKIEVELDRSKLHIKLQGIFSSLLLVAFQLASSPLQVGLSN